MSPNINTVVPGTFTVQFRDASCNTRFPAARTAPPVALLWPASLPPRDAGLFCYFGGR